MSMADQGSMVEEIESMLKKQTIVLSSPLVHANTAKTDGTAEIFT